MAPLQVTEARGVKIYNVSSGKTLPEWLSEKKKKSLRKDEDYKARIELIQDLDFECASNRIKFSKDGKFLAAVGMYPPQVKVYELEQLSMKFERHMDCEVVQFEILSDDYSKMAFLQADRTIEFHAKFGTYYKTRIPRVGRDMVYDPESCDLYVVGSSPEVYRLNLEQGRFLKPLSLLAEASSCLDRSSVHGLLAFGTDAGVVECWDPRLNKRAGITDVAAAVRRSGAPDGGGEVTAVRFDSDGLKMAVGTASGHTLVYDLRSSTPVLVKDHYNSLPIKDVRFHHTGEGSYLLAADPKIMKVWDVSEGASAERREMFASVEPPADINEITVSPASGLVLMACEQPRMHVYFVPALGAAPPWCSFLDSLTDELEETKRSEVYDDYKFVTREELESLGLSNLAGTGMLKAYMHGFFIDAKLYARSKSVLEPFAYEEYRKQKVREKIEAKQGQRIVLPQKTKPKVNKEFAEQLEQSRAKVQADIAETGKIKSGDKKRLSAQSKVLTDDRFSAMFQKEAFQIDKGSNEYRLLHPSETAAERRVRDGDDEGDDDDDDVALDHFDAVESEEEEEESDDDDEGLA
eukprot:CAMPEP_0206228282 /NCGR_PEP_ID=MMETSP0047_2-20121206/9088_1 /ASSEMBLY_ACC=CAM_ASM_000192 /TAXON_ID=195065 /ORGANISM="Chroomonas mesostigmatica_cf, Strain CCMP1168" /LENGTH=577 /DNA_ID=CAMNT_0053651519 /DNA_START=41 /DNA_END=1771 /DNA_ORIENTATION=+